MNTGITHIFDEWFAKPYLEDYYTHITPEEYPTIRYLSEQFSKIEDKPLMLEFGCGPTLHHVFLAAPFVSEIHMGDYIPENLKEIQKWLHKDEGAHDWTPFVAYTLECEGIQNPSIDMIREREDLTRSKITKLIEVDASKTDPAGIELREQYPLVMSCYCADSATSDQETWTLFMRNIASMVQPTGLFITTALRKTLSYRVGERFYPSANIDESSLRDVLALDFDPASITIEIGEFEEHADQGFSSILLAHSIKK